ncbi:uncharacterized protein TRIREDRAFT_105718 [Trichoderma reesei QM6a]|uniref:Predicted protein n=2 Tax=Hypocrea jecorina TaxID=51453 RepID=G0REG0_HYPJQ|nr:uncharacterized protein TRIREDRAFT_105718 [Trichoderma reesei QM6a]EGR50262.1 predicted protein [Trichoderma reesei QM6a]ETS04063.1 hypothetical protein M419DRAFT_128461 [Trichoderma reesei RUT C-30]
MPHQTRHPPSSSSSTFNKTSYPSAGVNTTTTTTTTTNNNNNNDNTTSSNTRHRHTQPPNNAPNPLRQTINQNTFIYPPKTPTRLTPRPRRSSLTSRIARHLSHAWKSFKKRSLAYYNNNERYQYTLIRTKRNPHTPHPNIHLSTHSSQTTPRPHRRKHQQQQQHPHHHRPRPRVHHHHTHRRSRPQPPKQNHHNLPYPDSSQETLMPPTVPPISPHHQAQLPSTPVASTPGLPPWSRPNLPPLQPAVLPLSYFCRVTPYQPDQIPIVQSPYYFLVHLSEDQIAPSPTLQQQGEQSPLIPNHLVSPYSLYRP